MPIDLSPQLFEKLPPHETGIDFANILQEEIASGHNRFQFDYFYNGAGVGVADLNNDGLQDLVFTGNQVDNKIYLNKGNLRFEDLINNAGINKNKGWSTGVTFADVNQDGLLDIYISQGGPLGFDRSNLLFINQGNMKFSEEASSYGLADQGITTQSVFFDYDRDGDLDCLVMNENPLYGYPPGEFHYVLKNEPNILEATSSHLYRQEEGHFVDITKEAGLLSATFGLGLVASDINQDGWIDIYIANDYFIPDALYINQKDGTFKNEIKTRTGHVSFSGMGADIADINNDGHEDIFVLDMASKDHYRAKTLMASMDVKLFDYLTNKPGYQEQYMFNTLQLNNGDDTFQDISHVAGLAKTDWSWAGLLVDLNNDSNKDVLVTNGTQFSINNDYLKKIRDLEKNYPNEIPDHELEKLLREIPSEKLTNVLYRNEGHLKFIDVTKEWGLDEPTFSNGAITADLDKDGDLDIVINNNNDKASIYRNLTVEKKAGSYLRVLGKGLLSESFPKITIHYDGQIQVVEIKRVRGYLSAIEDWAHFGLGKVEIVDTVQVRWPSGKYEERYNVEANNTITFNEEDAKADIVTRKSSKGYFEELKDAQLRLSYAHKESVYDDFVTETLLPCKQSTMGPFLSKGDINGDGADDVFIGGAKGEPGVIYIQNKGRFYQLNDAVLNADRQSEDMGSLIFDFDQDGDNDLLVLSGGNEHKEGSKQYANRLYLNDGQGHFTKSGDNLLDTQRLSSKSVASIDYDRDGDNDLIIGNRMVPGKYPLSSPSFIYENEKGVLKDVTDSVAPDLLSFGAVNQVISTDFNNDQWTDFIVVGEWTGIGFFRNVNGAFVQVTDAYGLGNLKGWWFSVTETDANNDGFKDYIIGNIGLNSKYKASNDEPLRIYSGDFDVNGTYDMMLSYQYKDNYVPLRGLECSSGQIPILTKKFPTYSSFANATIVDLFGAKNVENAYLREVTEFRSILLLNNKGQSFDIKPLPIEAQLFPLLSCVPYDINGDGFEDLILAGGIYNTEVETPRLDAGTGLILLSDGEGIYTNVKSVESGLDLKGNVKSLALIRLKETGTMLLMAGVNNDNLRLFETGVN
ncbi:MAG: VCBS repeat-containing protein [Bacteroidetes bacterium]|nr:VCBS repeat-containing protein [Bacteroidota bacterium]MDA1119301.1 VCBS repeat-containing protein [Bacteroidota bacterium]